MTTRDASVAMPADGIKRVIFTQEAWYAETASVGRHVTEEWSLGVDPTTGGGTYGEWAITWRDLQGRLTWRLEVFGDGLAYAMASGLLDLLCREEDAGPQRLREVLFSEGWIDMTERKHPSQKGD